MTRIAFVVNGQPTSPMGERARSFAVRLEARHEIRIFYRSRRKVWSIAQLTFGLLRYRPRVCYILDMGYSGIASGFLFRCLTWRRLIVDTGDAIAALAKSMGRGRIGVALTSALEWFSLRIAHRVVVRGTYHAELLRQRHIRADVIQDGVDIRQFREKSDDGLRGRLGLDGKLTVGLVGSSIWNERTKTCYGWDLVELVRLLVDRPVQGVMIGDGDGIALLRERCRTYGIEDRVRFLGRFPYDELPTYLGAIDVCLSTQTNDLVGRVRTTGKLPLYLASGRYILASNVGEAALVLPPEMLVDFAGDEDAGYPAKLAERVRLLLDEPAILARGQSLTRAAAEAFDYDVLTQRLERIIEETASGKPANSTLVDTAARGEGKPTCSGT